MRLVASTALVLLLGTSTAGAATLFSATLNDAQEVAPGGTSNTTGEGRASLQLIETVIDGGPYVSFSIFSLALQLDFDPVFNFRNFPGGIDNGGTQIVAALHIHNQVRGQNGGVVWGIFEPDHDTDNDSVLFNNSDGSTRIISEWDETEGNSSVPVTLLSFLSALQTAGPGQDVPLYLNLHTNLDGAGAIRGQIVGAPEPALALLVLAGFGAAAWRRRSAS
jgi:hypothetical protein